MAINRTAVNRDIGLLHPKFGRVVANLEKRLRADYEAGRTHTLFKLYEGFRLPDRQAYLKAQGATKAGPWQSAHQFGLAADFVPLSDGKWSWDAGHDWDHLARSAKVFGASVPISWDLAHVQAYEWDELWSHLKATGLA